MPDIATATQVPPELDTSPVTPSALPKEGKVTKKRHARRRQAVGQRRVTVPAETLPRASLRDAVRVAQALHENYASIGASWDDLARALQVSRTTNATKYLFWAAMAYGVVIRGEEPNSFLLSETGRQIVAPTYEGEDTEAKQKAALTPTILSKFYSSFNSNLVPKSELLPNVLENRFGVPRERTQEAIQVILDTADFAGILEKLPGGTMRIDLRGVATSATPAHAASVADGIADGLATPPTGGDAVQWKTTCFFVTPIGDEGTEVRKHADMVQRHLLEPVAKELGLTVVRADKIGRPGLITQQVFEYLTKSRLCVADLSFGNPNAFYELGVRHMCMLATIQLTRKGDKIPFDVSQGRTIVVDTSDVYTIMDRFETARRELKEHCQHVFSAASDDSSDDNPVRVYLPGLRVELPR